MSKMKDSINITQYNCCYRIVIGQLANICNDSNQKYDTTTNYPRTSLYSVSIRTFVFYIYQYKMGKLIVQEWISLDGYAEDANGGLDFFTSYSEPMKRYDEYQLKLIDTIDTMLIGRKTYELFVNYWPTELSVNDLIADSLNGLNKVVLSNTLSSADWGNWSAAAIFQGNTASIVRNLKATTEGNIIVWGSIGIAQELLRQELVDELNLFVCPTILGGGRQLLPGDSHSNWQLMSAQSFEMGMVNLLYQKVTPST